MLQSRRINPGAKMEHIYEEIQKEFSNKQAQALVYTLELFQRRILESQTEEVIYKTRNSLSNEFATKSDLEKNILEAKLELKTDIANVKTELKTDIANVKTELKAVQVDTLKWVGAGLVASITIILAGVGLMIKFL